MAAEGRQGGHALSVASDTVHVDAVVRTDHSAVGSETPLRAKRTVSGEALLTIAGLVCRPVKRLCQAGGGDAAALSPTTARK